MVTFLTRETLVFSGALLLSALLAILLYNSLVQARTRAREALAGIEVQLKRRADLVPNLVAAVNGYAAHERRVLDEVTQTRAEAAAFNIRLLSIPALLVARLCRFGPVEYFQAESTDRQTVRVSIVILS
jgi:hypothetical protein